MREDGKLEIIPEEAETIRLIVRRITEGRSLKEVRTELDLRGFRTRFNNRWTIPQIKALVLHYPEVHPCIISPSVIQKAKGVLKRMTENTDFDPTTLFQE
jgi:hypothetical protein